MCLVGTYHADEYEDKLDNVCVGHGVKASHQCVHNDHGGRDPDADVKG